MEGPLVMLFGLLVWVGVFGSVGGWIAKEKGRDPGEGALLGIFLGLIGWIIEACLPADEKASSKLSQRKCPFCAELVKCEAIVCRFCGRDIGKKEQGWQPRISELHKPMPSHTCRVCKEAWQSWIGDEMCPRCRMAYLNLRKRRGDLARRIRWWRFVGFLRGAVMANVLGRVGSAVVISAVVGGVAIGVFSASAELFMAVVLGVVVGTCVGVIVVAMLYVSESCDSLTEDAKVDLRRVERSISRFREKSVELVASK